MATQVAAVGASEATRGGGLTLVWSEQVAASGEDDGTDWWRILAMLGGVAVLAVGTRGLWQTGVLTRGF